jgi:hypothetical protein
MNWMSLAANPAEDHGSDAPFPTEEPDPSRGRLAVPERQGGGRGVPPSAGHLCRESEPLKQNRFIYPILRLSIIGAHLATGWA